MMCLADQHQALDAALDELARLPVFLLRLVLRAREKQRVPVLAKLVLQRLHRAREVALRERRKDRSDGRAAARGECAGGAMRHPAQMPDD